MQSSGSSSAENASATSRRGGQPRNRFALTGSSIALDPRIDAVRRDLADVRLAARVFAPHYAQSVRRTAGRSVPLTAEPNGEALIRSEILAGEPFDVLEMTSTHFWGRSPIDGSVGYVACDAFSADRPATHLVRVASTSLCATAEGDVIAKLYLGERVVASGTGDILEVDGSYVTADSLVELSELVEDPVVVAIAALGVPHRAGGRSGAGIDPAGLVSLAMIVAGLGAPRFLDLQAAEVGRPLDDGEREMRGDMLFFADHVAIVIDDASVVHVGIEKVERCRRDALASYGPVVVRRRVA